MIDSFYTNISSSMKKISKPILIAAGWIFVSLGIIGIFVPLMPSTIFFIIAAWCFARSSQRFYDWLINHPRFGKTVKDYYEKRAMPLKSKVYAIVLLVGTISLSAIFFTQKTSVRIILFIIAVSVSAYIISLRTLKKAEPQ